MLLRYMDIMGNPNVTYVDLRKNPFGIVILGFFNVQFPQGNMLLRRRMVCAASRESIPLKNR